MVNSKLILIGLAIFCSSTVYGQTLEQAKKMFTEGNFEESKPVFEKLVKQSPSNASYNFWYGACCFETGEYSQSQPYLEKAAKRQVINAYLYLGRLYYKLYRFEEAVDNIEEHIMWLEKKKRDTEAAEAELDRCRRAERMIRAVENVAVIDSFVVDKNEFLSAYRLSKETGTISFTDDGGTQFVSEMGDKRFFPKADSEGKTELYMQSKMIDKWGRAEALESLNARAENLGYPFMDSDGITFYYAAESEESIGGYDIFVTRYDSEDGTFLRPNNIGMPFNSTANDYMYVIDDFNGLGWFASDRFQPDDKVCVYVFVPNEQRISYDYEETDQDLMICLASLQSIKATWTDPDITRQGRQLLAAALYSREESKVKKDFEFVINDNKVYTKLADFRSSEARSTFQQYLQKQKELTALEESVEKQRITYSSSSKSGKEKMSATLLAQEKLENNLRHEVQELALKARNIENSVL